MEKRVLMIASVASMIDLFNKDNLLLLKQLGMEIDVAANFKKGNITSQERVNEFKNELKFRGIKVIDWPCPRSVFRIVDIIKSYKILKKLVDRSNYRIVHCHSPIGGVIVRIACISARKNGTKMLYTVHGFHFFKGSSILNWLFFYPIEKLCSRFTDILLTMNQEDYQLARKWNTCKVEYIPGIGIHTKNLRNISVNKKAYRKEFGLEEEDFVFMSTGQVSLRKNHEVIIRALAEIDNPNVKYLIVGFGELIEHHKALAKKLEVEHRVIFTGYRNDVKYILHAVDGFVFPSLQEGLPVALMEAMSWVTCRLQ